MTEPLGSPRVPALSFSSLGQTNSPVSPRGGRVRFTLGPEASEDNNRRIFEALQRSRSGSLSARGPAPERAHARSQSERVAPKTPRGLRSEESQEEEQTNGDKTFEVINQAIKLLKPMTLSHKAEEKQSHEQKNTLNHKYVIDFRDALHTAHTLGMVCGKRSKAFSEIAASYRQKLHERCQKFLAEHSAIKDPPFPENLTLLSPRGRQDAKRNQKTVEEMQQTIQKEKTLSAFQKALKVAQCDRDALVNDCIADICAFALDYDDEFAEKAESDLQPIAAAGAPVQLTTAQKAWASFKKLLSSD